MDMDMNNDKMGLNKPGTGCTLSSVYNRLVSVGNDDLKCEKSVKHNEDTCINPDITRSINELITVLANMQHLTTIYSKQDIGNTIYNNLQLRHYELNNNHILHCTIEHMRK